VSLPVSRSDQSTYRQDIDGLRAVAVLSVLMFHTTPMLVPGGFVGVDIFFVVSGFLITSLIAAEMRAGTFSVLSFYDRRIRRIMPALAVVIAASMVLGYFILWPGDYEDLGTSAGYATIGLANIFFHDSTGYFDQRSALQPLLHLWSLGVEEQFYVVWPLLLFLMIRIVGFKPRALSAILLSLVVGAFLAAVLAERADPKAAFYLTPYRAWELGIGCMLALLPAFNVRDILRELVGVVGLSLIVYAIFALDASSRFPGANALLPCLGAAMMIWSSHDRPSLTGRCLSWRPIRSVGLMSYSLYLIHWPTLAFVRHYNNGADPGPAQLVLAPAASLLLAWLSWRYVEQPFRGRRTRPVRSVATGVATAAGVTAFAFGIAATAGLPWRVPDHLRPLLSRDIMWDWTCPRDVVLNQTYLCQFGSNWDTATSKAFLWGDSHAEHLVPLMEAASSHTGAAYALNRQCPAVLGGMLRLSIPPNQAYNNNARCMQSRQTALDLLRAHPEIDTVILASAWEFMVRSLRLEPPGSPTDGYLLLEQGFQEIVDDVGLIGDFPVLPIDPVGCLAGEAVWRRHCDRTALQISKAAYERQQGTVNQILRTIAARNRNVKVIIPGDVICDDKICLTDWNGEFLYRDTDHVRRNLTAATRASLAGALGF
jgi:peptidoglycan/LPS O-acetylase OafA/YrhL